MKLVKQTLIATAVASALLSSHSAMAEWTNGPGNSTTVIIQSTANTTGVSASSQNATFHLTTSPQQSLTVNDQVIFKLTGGAKFIKSGTNVPVLATGSQADITSSTNLNTTNFSFDGFFEDDGVTPNATTGPIIKFHATVAGGVASNSYLQLNTSTLANTTALPDPLTPSNIFNLSGVAAGTNVDMSITTKNVNGAVINAIDSIGLFGSHSENNVVVSILSYLFTGANLLSCTGSQVASKTNTAEVTENFKKFNDGFGPNPSLIGTALDYTTASNAAAPAIPANPIGADKIVYKIVGDFTGIASITASGVTGSDSAGSTSGGSVGQFLINAAKTEAYATNTLALAGGASLALTPQFNINGTTSQGARTFTFSTKVLADPTNTWTEHNVACDAATYTITRNGSSFITNANGATRIRITDVSGSILSGSGKINITAYDAAGNVVPLSSGSTFAPGNLSPRQTRIINGTELAAAYPGAIQFEFAVESPAIEASSLRIVNGAVQSVTVYTNKEKTGGI